MGRSPKPKSNVQESDAAEANSQLVVIGGREINQISYSEDIKVLDRPAQASMEINEDLQRRPIEDFRNLGDILRNNAKIIRLAAMTTVDGLTATHVVFDKISGVFVKTPDYKARLAALTFLRDSMNGRPGSAPPPSGAGDRGVDISSLMADPDMAKMIVDQSSREAAKALTALQRNNGDETHASIPRSRIHPLESIAAEAEALTGRPLSGAVQSSTTLPP